MVLRTGKLTKQQWSDRIHELLTDIGKEADEYALEIYEMAVNMALDAKDALADEEEM